MGFLVRLTREGFSHEEDGETEIFRPGGVFELLRFWHWGLAGIDEDVTLGDLFRMLAEVEGIENLSPMFSTDLEALFEEMEKPANIDPDDMVEHVEVYNHAELSTYVPDPDRPDEPLEWIEDEEEEAELDRVEEGLADLTGEERPLKIYDATGEDPITGKPKSVRLKSGEMYGKWAGPYSISRGFHGWGRWEEPYEGYFEKNPEIDPSNYRGGWSLSFTSVQDLLHYPLRYNASLVMTDDLYGGNVLVDDTLKISVGEFIHAIFWDLGFYGPPEQRDAVKESLKERVADLREEGEWGE